MHRKRIIGWFFAASSALLLGGCERVLLEEMAGLTGTEVSFGASTMWQNEDETRTEYSGSLTTTSPKYERIDWTPPTDRIRIVCAEVETDTKTLADYDLLPTATADGKVSQASIRPSSSSPTNGNGLHWGSGTHHFFAWYPAPGMASNYSSTTTVGSESSITLVSGETAATVTGTIPATQTPVSRKTTTKNNVTTTEYKPNMNYAYMYAHATGTPTGSNVLLQFKPLVTALEFTLKAGDNTSKTYRLKSLKLTSTSSNLTGKFTIKLKSDGGYDDSATTAYQSTGKTITVPFSNTPTLNTTNLVKATVLCLPVKQTALTVTLTLDTGNGTTEFTRTLPLQFSNGNSIEVAATKKAYISNVGVPGTTYYLDVTPPTATTFSNLGARNTFKVKSYSNTGGTNTAEAWTAQFSTDNGSSWSSTAPAWVYGASSGTNITTSGAGGDTFTTYTFELEANQNEASLVSTSNRRNNFDKSHALDVSMYSATGAKLSSRCTANCYVITRPGWYKIPLAYGCSIREGATITNSFRPGGTSATGYNSTTKCRKQFVNHAGNGITNPWLCNNSVTADGAQLLWQDNGTATITDLSVGENSSGQVTWLYFKVSDSYVQGNAVVGAFVGSTIVWSWHLWLNSNPGSDLATQTVQYKGTDGNNNFTKSVAMMKIDLGQSKQHSIAKTNARSVQVKITQTSSGKTSTFTITQNGRAARTDAAAYPPYYQWGRKDPFTPADGNHSHSVFHTTTGSYQKANSTNMPQQATVQAAIQHPNVFYRVGWDKTQTTFRDDWCSQTTHNLWDALDHTGVDAPVTKTIYDPCPYGFTIPSRNAFTGFVTVAPPYASGSNADNIRCVKNSNGTVQYNNGYTFYTNSAGTATMFFEGTGLINCETGRLSYGGDKADRWMSVHDLNSSGGELPRDFIFVNTPAVGPLNTTGTRAWGAIVRPVKDSFQSGTTYLSN